jgi:hypothetical protein
MNVRELLQKVSSVGAAAAALLGSSHSEARPPTNLTDTFKDASGDPPVEPLLLERAPIKEEPLLLAGHSSHSSHSSHYSSSGGGSVGGHASHTSHTSHYSSSTGGGYAPAYPGTGTYTPPAVAPKTYTPPRPYTPTEPTVAATPAPVEMRKATPVNPVTHLEFNNGLVLYGFVLAKSEEGISFRTLDNAKTYKFKRGLLTPATLAALGFAASTAQR